MSDNPLVKLHAHGQSFWYDNIRRKYLFDGTLRDLLANDGLRGMTSNPSIFAKAIGGSDDYDEQMKALVAAGASVDEIYEALVLEDIRTACDLFAPLYAESDGGDGYVSLEVSPLLANDTAGTIAEAVRLFSAVDRPNLMIKVPATPAGIPAIKELIGRGININITLMFNMAHYEAVAQAYLDGLHKLIVAGGDPTHVASVASFFVSRVDSAVDAQLEAIGTPAAAALMGKAAIANAKVVYQRFLEIFHGEPFAPLQAAGGTRQRLLWASTSTKNPSYPDTMYIDELIGPETVNTMPPATIDAFRDHGVVADQLLADVAEAEAQLAGLTSLGIDLSAITETLQEEGVDSFAKAFAELMDTIESKRERLAGS